MTPTESIHAQLSAMFAIPYTLTIAGKVGAMLWRVTEGKRP